MQIAASPVKSKFQKRHTSINLVSKGLGFCGYPNHLFEVPNT